MLHILMLLMGTCTFTNAFNRNMYIYECFYSEHVHLRKWIFFFIILFFFQKNFMCIFLNHIVFVEVKMKYCIHFFSPKWQNGVLIVYTMMFRYDLKFLCLNEASLWWCLDKLPFYEKVKRHIYKITILCKNHNFI